MRKAKEASMPKDNIERAIAKGTGEGGEADAIESVLYEGYGPGGVAVLVEALTENRNRTGADVRHAFSKNGGSLGEPGSVAYLFDKKGMIVIDAERYSEDDLMVAVEAGAEDISADEDVFEVVTEPADFARVRQALEEAGVEMESAEMAYRPSSVVPIDETQAASLMRLIDTLEEQRRRERGARQLRRVGRRARTCRRLSGRSPQIRRSLRLRPAVVILCGGRGTRLQEHTQEIPKPLVEIGGMPIVWHVIQLYAEQGFRRFLLATGYRGELIERFAATHSWPAGVSVECVRHGPRRPRRAGASSCWSRAWLASGCSARPTRTGSPTSISTRCCTSTRARGARHMTVVRPQLQFGVTELDGRRPCQWLSREADARSTGSTAASSASTRPCSTACSPTACSSARLWSGWRRPVSCAPSATRASGSAWTPTRTPFPSTTCGRRGRRRGARAARRA